MFTVLITGSRDYLNSSTIKNEIEALNTGETKFIVGDAPSGVDSIVTVYLEEENILYEVFKAEWKTYGKIAGHIRNDEMLDENPDLVLAFWDGSSSGTKSVIDKALFRGINLKVVFDD